MIIQKKRIRNVKRYLGLPNGEGIIIAMRNLNEHSAKLVEMGFSQSINPGEQVLPAKTFGPISTFNAEGKYKKLKHLPKETCYRQHYWEWQDWGGNWHSDIVDIPYQRYPRQYINPPSIELTISTKPDGEKIICYPENLIYSDENISFIRHIINLYLEIFGECHIFRADLNDFSLPKIKKLNWIVLPQGEYPWNRLNEKIGPIVNDVRNSEVILYRLKTIHNAKPDFIALGTAGFHGYIVYGFEKRNIYIFESIYFGNATYIFEDDWENLSKLTKAEILNFSLQKDRIIHSKNWANQLSGYL